MCSSVLWPLFQTLGSYSIRGSVSSHNYSVDPDYWAWDSGLTLACSSYCVIPFSGSLNFLSIHSPPVHSWSHHSKAKRNIYGQSASGSLEILLCIVPVKVIPVPHYFDNFKFVSYIHDSTYVLQISSFALSLSLFFKDSIYKWYHMVFVFLFGLTSLTMIIFASAADKSLQSCPTLCEPIDGSPPGSPVPGILQERTLEWIAISFSNAWKWKVKVKSLSRVRLLATSWTAAHQAPPSMGFSRQEYWSGLPLPSPNQVTIKTQS